MFAVFGFVGADADEFFLVEDGVELAGDVAVVAGIDEEAESVGLGAGVAGGDVDVAGVGFGVADVPGF